MVPQLRQLLTLALGLLRVWVAFLLFQPWRLYRNEKQLMDDENPIRAFFLLDPKLRRRLVWMDWEILLRPFMILYFDMNDYECIFPAVSSFLGKVG